MKGRVGNLLNGNGITKSLIGYMTPYLLAQVSGFLSTLLGSNSAPPPQVDRGDCKAKYLAHSSLALEAAVSWKREPLCLKKGAYFSVSGPG